MKTKNLMLCFKLSYEKWVCDRIIYLERVHSLSQMLIVMCIRVSAAHSNTQIPICQLWLKTYYKAKKCHFLKLN